MNMNIHDLMVMNNSLKHSSQQMTECKLKREYNLFNRKKPNYNKSEYHGSTSVPWNVKLNTCTLNEFNDVLCK